MHSIEAAREAYGRRGAPGYGLARLIARLRGEVPTAARTAKYATTGSGRRAARARVNALHDRIKVLEQTFDTNLERWWTHSIEDTGSSGATAEGQDAEDAAIALTLATESSPAVLALRSARRSSRPMTAPAQCGGESGDRKNSTLVPPTSPLAARAVHLQSARVRWEHDLADLRAQGSGGGAEPFVYEPFCNVANELFALPRSMRKSRSIVSVASRSSLRPTTPGPGGNSGERSVRVAKRSHRLSLLSAAPTTTFWFDALTPSDLHDELELLIAALFDAVPLRKACSLFFHEVPLAWTMIRDIYECEDKLRARQLELRRSVGSDTYKLMTSKAARAACSDSQALAAAKTRVRQHSVRLRILELVRLERTIIDSKALLLRKFHQWRHKFLALPDHAELVERPPTSGSQRSRTPTRP
ncbi:uncharacterized protein AMSG_03237 [Thecamonas trahens ATCC 50062]|uniref:Uncharacterized protein n=1 Tax=Thecamonas trahens ATCC 50062 TaxID=461836 RepID=A0A0L0D3Z1_THETB|nr:hypothetical protein AMSG_03237 [Thecamonas trahens ATCC 50062]KNC46806.1 hypothetical protein AMSG_03237 [Thecamonas trahens ATCC 50062]|eukprot:XP_013760081.1 hypothetical protein AMSG_03237 [Thecamonas trahens ATCC 50062]